MDRNEAVALIREHVKGDFLFKHMLATEAIMKEVAAFLGENVDLWGLTGLLHDIDFEETKENTGQHGILAEKYIGGKVPGEVVRAINAHASEYNGAPAPSNKMEIALLSADAITGLVVAAALVKPDKKLSSVTIESVRNAFKKKGFAAGSNRNNIKRIEEIGIPLDKFFELSLTAMQKIAPQLGL